MRTLFLVLAVVLFAACLSRGWPVRRAWWLARRVYVVGRDLDRVRP